MQSVDKIGYDCIVNNWNLEGTSIENLMPKSFFVNIMIKRLSDFSCISSRTQQTPEEKECYEGDVGGGLVELIMEAKMMREENNFFTYQGSFSFKDDRNDDRNEIQRILLEEMSFTNSDNSQDLSGERWWSVSSSSSSDNNHNVSGECI